MAQDAGSPDLAAAVSSIRASVPANFDHEYIERVVIPFSLTNIYSGSGRALPMIDTTLSKENAMPQDLWGLIYKGWKPSPDEGVTVFLQALENRGDNNLRKRIYFSARHPRPIRSDVPG